MIDVVLGERQLVGEGPIWDVAKGRLLWVDIGAATVHALEPVAGKTETWHFDQPVTAICPASPGRYVAATQSGVCELDLIRGTLSPLIALPSGDRMNDAKADPTGRLVGGTMTNNRTPGAGGLYRFDNLDSVTTLVPAVTVSNGLGWSPDGTLLYFVDSPTQRIDVFRYDTVDGSVSDGRTFADLHDWPGRPDGLTVDQDGNVWVVMIRGSLLLHVDPTGVVTNTIELPTSLVTSCTFGGPNLADLYVTSSSVDLADNSHREDELAGALFRIRTEAHGLLPTPCTLLDTPL